ncbi:MAG: energy transducer TonB [Bacteroidota bacterium]
MKSTLFISTILVTLLSTASYGQKTDTLFYDGNWKATTKSNQVYYRIATPTDDGHFLVKDYYKDGSLHMTGAFKTLSPEVKDGEFTWYYLNGNKKTTSTYVADKSTKTTEWNDDGTEATLVSLDTQPAYPGGMNKFYEYIGENFEYPRRLKPRPKGVIILSFYIEKDGTITEVKVDRSVNPLLDAEAVRLLKEMEKWKPGIKDGKAVRVKYNIPLNME